MCGRYGFNCGSTLYMTGFGTAQSAGLVAVNTTLAPAAGGIAALILRRFVLAPRMLTVSESYAGRGKLSKFERLPSDLLSHFKFLIK